MILKTLQFLAIVLTALSLVPGGAHLFALLNKIGLPAEHYFVVQGIYRGWNLFGFVLIPAVIVNLLLAFLTRADAFASAMSFLAGACMVGALVIFFVWVEPSNRATDYWTTIPADWQALRRQWEYGHAAGAVLTFVALCSATIAVMTGRE